MVIGRRALHHSRCQIDTDVAGFPGRPGEGDQRSAPSTPDIQDPLPRPDVQFLDKSGRNRTEPRDPTAS